MDDVWLEISKHLSDIRDYVSLKSSSSCLYHILPKIVLLDNFVIIQNDIQVNTADDFLSAQHVYITLNGTNIVDFFFAASSSGLQLHSLSILCLSVHCYIPLQYNLYQKDIIFSQSGSLVSFAKQNYLATKENVLKNIFMFLFPNQTTQARNQCVERKLIVECTDKKRKRSLQRGKRGLRTGQRQA